MPSYNPPDAFFLLNSALNANNFYAGKNIPRIVNWDQNLNELQLVDTITGNILKILGGGANVADLGSILFVSENGDNTSGTKGRIDLPYATIGAAETAASLGDTIFVFPGQFNATALGKDGITYYFCAGAVVNQPVIGPASYLFSDATLPLGGKFTVLGEGNFTNLFSNILGQKNGSQIYIEGNRFVTGSTGEAAFYSESTVANADPSNTTTIVADEIVSLGNGVFVYTENATSTMTVMANKIQSTATTIVTFDASLAGLNTPTLRVTANNITNVGRATDSINIHNIGGKIYVNCPEIVKTELSPDAPVVLMNPGSPNQEGYVEINGTINYLPNAGLGATDYMLYMGAGSSKISANIYGDAASLYAGGLPGTAYSHYLEGYIESLNKTGTGVATITIGVGTAHKVFVNAIVKNKHNGAASYGIESRADAALVVMQNCVVSTQGVINSVVATAGLSIYSYPGSCANNAISVGSELVGNILVSANVVVPNLNP